MDALEELRQMRLHEERVEAIRQNLDQLIVAEEEKPGEGEALCLEVTGQARLHRVQVCIPLYHRL